jgi:hypothetical protein
MNKTISHLYMVFFKKVHLYQLNRLYEFSLFFGPVRFVSVQLTPSPPFPLLGAASPSADVVMPPCCVTLPSHWAKTSSLPPLHFSATFCPVASPLNPKLKHWICTTAIDYPRWTTRLPSSTAIKRSSQPYPLSLSLNCISILPPP